MKIVYAVLKLGERQLVSLVRDDAGTLRSVTVKWSKLTDPFTPPESWASSALGEAEFQRAEEANPNPLRNI